MTKHKMKCSCGAELTDMHRDICLVYEDLVQGELSSKNPAKLLELKMKSKADAHKRKEESAMKICTPLVSMAQAFNGISL